MNASNQAFGVICDIRARLMAMQAVLDAMPDIDVEQPQAADILATVDPYYLSGLLEALTLLLRSVRKDAKRAEQMLSPRTSA